MKDRRFLILIAISVFSGMMTQPCVFAEETNAEVVSKAQGWTKGEKKGWKDGELPPGLSEKEARRIHREKEKQARKAEKEAHKKAKMAKKEAHKKKMMEKAAAK